MQSQAEEEEEEGTAASDGRAPNDAPPNDTAASDGRAPPPNDTLQTHYSVSAPPVCVCLCVCVRFVCVCVADRVTEVACMQGVLLMQIPYRCDGKGIGTWHTACKQATHRNVHQQGVPALHPQAKAVLFTFRELLSGSDWQGVRVKCACQVCVSSVRWCRAMCRAMCTCFSRGSLVLSQERWALVAHRS